MINPLKDQKYTIGYKFGDKTFYNTKHLGVDFIAPKDTNVYAPVSGITKHFKGGQAGIAIYLQGDDGREHRLMHLAGREVKNNEQVKEGQLIGRVGNTGLSTGSHLHWDIRTKPTTNIKDFLDPLAELKRLNNNMDTISAGEAKKLIRAFGITYEPTDENAVELAKKPAGVLVTELLRHERFRDIYGELKAKEEELENMAKQIIDITELANENNRLKTELAQEKEARLNSAEKYREEGKQEIRQKVLAYVEKSLNN